MNKTAKEVTADYLRMIWKHTTEHIAKHNLSGWSYCYKVVITVPAVWDETARLQTKEAAKEAGISDEISLVSEPEAAALAVFQDKLGNRDILEVCARPTNEII